MLEKIIQTVGEVLKIEVNKNTSQKNCIKWDSLMHIHIIIALEATFDVSFEPEEINQMNSIGNIEHFILLKCPD